MGGRHAVREKQKLQRKHHRFSDLLQVNKLITRTADAALGAAALTIFFAHVPKKIAVRR